MLSTLSVSNIISESMALKDRIKLESVPCDDYIEMVIEAMKKGVRIAVKYRKYGSDKFSNLNFEPYCLKMFMQRWYVLGHFFRAATPEKEGAYYNGVFSFDRILEMEITDIPFVVKDEFDAQEYFCECMGVIAGDGTKAVNVVIRAFGEERYYLRDLPLHQSQKEIGQGEDFADFEYYIRPTIDFRMAIIARGCHVKVLEPESLIEEIRKEHKDALQLYEKK
jgi:predicted DNA-binding transcriptional regulator YafY